jgi:hypothetical protein
MRSLHKIIIMKEFIIIFMLLFPSITPIKTNSSIPDFGRMMNQKREDIKRLRESNIDPDRRNRYSENYYTKNEL